MLEVVVDMTSRVVMTRATMAGAEGHPGDTDSHEGWQMEKMQWECCLLNCISTHRQLYTPVAVVTPY